MSGGTDYRLDGTARWVFGERLSDPVAERILAALRAAPEGMKRAEVRDLFDQHKSSGEIDRALGTLVGAALVQARRVETGGRPATVWQILDSAAEASAELSTLSTLITQPAFCARARAFLADMTGEGTGSAVTDCLESVKSVERSDRGSDDPDSPRCVESVKSVVSPADPTDARASLLALAEARGWPRLDLRPGWAVAAGADNHARGTALNYGRASFSALPRIRWRPVRSASPLTARP